MWELPKYNSGSFHNFSRWSYGNFRKGKNMKKINFILVTLIVVFSINLSAEKLLNFNQAKDIHITTQK